MGARRTLLSGRGAAVLSAVVVLASPRLAPAQTRDPAAAEALFRAGRDAAERHDWREACDKLRESQRLDPAAGTLLNIAICEEALGELATAWQHYQQVVAELADSDDRLPYARQLLADLSNRVPRLTVRAAPGSPADMVVTRDGVEMGGASLGMAVPVNPGRHVIRVTAAGRQAREYEVALREAATEVVEVAPGAPLPAAEPDRRAPRAPRVAPAPTGSSLPRTSGFVAIGVGLTGVAVGAVTGALVFSKKAEVNDECERDPAGRLACSQQGLDASDAGRAFATTSTVSFVVGAASLAVGVFLVATDRRGTHTTAQSKVSRALLGGPLRF